MKSKQGHSFREWHEKKKLVSCLGTRELFLEFKAKRMLNLNYDDFHLRSVVRN